MGLTERQQTFWDQVCERLSLIQRWHAETAWAGADWCRIDAKRVGLRTDATAGRLLPVCAAPDGTLHLMTVDAGSSEVIAYPDHLVSRAGVLPGTSVYCWEVDNQTERRFHKVAPDLIRLLTAREGILEDRPWWVQDVGSRVLDLPQDPLWAEAVYTALLGDWPDPLTQQQELTPQAIRVLRAEARAIHRQLVPIWRRRTRHGRVLSLDADLGDGYCLLDLLAAQAGPQHDLVQLARDHQRIGALLRALTPLERHVVLTRATGEATTWTEAATACRIDNPLAFGDRVRRKVLRLIKEQQRRRQQSNGQWLSGSERSA